jgi:hypothetical protein
MLTQLENQRPDLSDKWRAYQWKIMGQKEVCLTLQERIGEECDEVGLAIPSEDTLRLCWDLIGRERECWWDGYVAIKVG